MSAINVLFVNAAGSVEGDTAMWLLGLSCLDANTFCIHVAATPRGAVFEQLAQLPNINLHPMEIGGAETDISRSLPGLRRLHSLAAVIRIAALAKRKKIDIIYTIDRTVGMAISYAVSRLTGCPLILSAHISFYLGHSRVHKLVMNHASCITVVSENMRREFLPYVDDPGKLTVVPNAIALERFDPTLDGLAVRHELGLKPSTPAVSLVGRIDPWKGQAELIQAAAIVLQVQPDTVFLLVGQGEPDYVHKMKQLADELDIGRSVLFLGYRNDIPHIQAAVDIATMPSHYEAFGLVALEAMAMAKPVVSTQAGGVPEFLIDGEMGRLVPPSDFNALADALLFLLDNPEKAKRMGIRGREHVARFYSSHKYQRHFERLFNRFTQGMTVGSG